LASSAAEQLAALQPAQLGASASRLGAASAVRAPRAIVVGAEVNRLAAKGAAMIYEGLVFLDGHLDKYGRVVVDLQCTRDLTWLEVEDVKFVPT